MLENYLATDRKPWTIALNRLKRYQEAKNLLIPLIEGKREATSADRDHSLASAITELGRAQSGIGETTNALASWNEALTLQRAKQPPNLEDIAMLEKLMARTKN